MAKAKDTTPKTAEEKIEILAGLASIQRERQAHDEQTKDQNAPVVDILDKRK